MNQAGSRAPRDPTACTAKLETFRRWGSRNRRARLSEGRLNRCAYHRPAGHVNRPRRTADRPERRPGTMKQLRAKYRFWMPPAGVRGDRQGRRRIGRGPHRILGEPEQSSLPVAQRRHCALLSGQSESELEQ